MEDPGLLSLLPVVVAIGLALYTRHVVLSLFAGVLTAAFLLAGSQPWLGPVKAFDPLIIDAIADRDHVKVTVFSLLIAAMVEVMGRSGGTKALVDAVTGRARTRRKGMVATWAAGMIVFFDDYANCLVVGHAMRPVVDRLRVSREKLAYLVDSTAAPMATVALVSTWIGYEVGLMGDALKVAGQHDVNAYSFFFEGLPYRFYPLLALVFGGTIAFSGRDFGPMLVAERRAAGAAEPVETLASTEGHHIWLAVLPVAALVLVTGLSLWVQGGAAAGPDAPLVERIGGADGYDAMLHGSIAALLLAVVLAVAASALNLIACIDAIVHGMRELFEPLLVLFLAWATASGIQALGAADTLVALLGDSISGAWLPTATYLVACAVSFATGTSFGTMGVLMPLVIPLSFAVGGGEPHVPLAAAAAVLSGAVWGDHCSPISDTTVLSASASGCELQAHVATQLPYAVVVGLLAVVLGTVPSGYGVSPWICLALGAAACIATPFVFGKKAEPA